MHVHMYFVSFLTVRSSSKWVILKNHMHLFCLGPRICMPKHLLHLHAAFLFSYEVYGKPNAPNVGRNCAIQLNKLSSISLFINQLLLYELLMTNYSHATQWAVQISSA